MPPSVASVPSVSRKQSARKVHAAYDLLIDNHGWNLVMQFFANQILAMTLIAAGLAPIDVGAQMSGQAISGQAVGTITPSNGAEGLTGKERLSEKWKDEQRIDNCKVPLDKRGTRTRPDSCAHPPKD
jgi:hypothetical protein